MCALKVPQEKRDVIKKMNAQGKTDSEIAKVIGFSSGTVGSYRRRMGLPPRSGPNAQPTTEEKSKITELSKRDLTFAEALEVSGYKCKRFSMIAKAAGVSFAKSRKAFSPEESEKIRIARDHGDSFYQIAKRLGRSEWAVSGHASSALFRSREGQALKAQAQLEPVPEKRKRVAIPPHLLRVQPDRGVKQAPQHDHLIARHGAALVAEVRKVPKHSKQASQKLAAIAARHGLKGPAVRTLWHRVAS